MFVTVGCSLQEPSPPCHASLIRNPGPQKTIPNVWCTREKPFPVRFPFGVGSMPFSRKKSEMAGMGPRAAAKVVASVKVGGITELREPELDWYAPLNESVGTVAICPVMIPAWSKVTNCPESDSA